MVGWMGGGIRTTEPCGAYHYATIDRWDADMHLLGFNVMSLRLGVNLSESRWFICTCLLTILSHTVAYKNINSEHKYSWLTWDTILRIYIYIYACVCVCASQKMKQRGPNIERGSVAFFWMQFRRNWLIWQFRNKKVFKIYTFKTISISFRGQLGNTTSTVCSGNMADGELHIWFISGYNWMHLWMIIATEFHQHKIIKVFWIIGYKI